MTPICTISTLSPICTCTCTCTCTCYMHMLHAHAHAHAHAHVHVHVHVHLPHYTTGDRHRWEQLKKWLALHPHVFRRQAMTPSAMASMHDAWLHDAWLHACCTMYGSTTTPSYVCESHIVHASKAGHTYTGDPVLQGLSSRVEGEARPADREGNAHAGGWHARASAPWRRAPIEQGCGCARL